MNKYKSIDQIKLRLLEDIGEKRLAHSIRVAETGVKLCKKYGLNEDDVFLAGLLHDCGRLKSQDDLLNNVDKFGIILDDISIHNIKLIHGPLGAKIAEVIYGVDNQEILNSIRYHTTGRENMGIIEKIIFISDYIEPKRNFEGIEDVRNLAVYDLDKSIILSMEQNIKFLIDKGKLIHIDTVKGLNYLKLENMKRGENNIE